MRIIKPLTLGCLHRPFEVPPRHFLAVAAVGFFDLDAPEDLHADLDLWKLVPKLLGPQAIFDLGMPKPRAEVLVAGEAQAPGGAAVDGLTVQLQLGAIDKKLAVIGDRQWIAGAEAVTARHTPPRPFTAMPVHWTHAFGGPACADNPLGRGHQAQKLLEHGQPAFLPNIEDPAHPVTDSRATVAPVGFGPLDFTWPQRQARAGHYDAQWVRKHYPGPAPDMDWTIYNAAPPDQWLPAMFTGREVWRLGNMHADRPILEGRLPAIRPRLFVYRHDDQGVPQPLEPTLKTETLWLFPNQLRGAVIWRGLIETRQADARDVPVILVAYERQSDPARPADHYHRELALRTDPATRKHRAFFDPPLIPEPDPREEAARQAARDQAAAAQVAAARKQLTAKRDQQLRKAGVDPATLAPPTPSPITPPAMPTAADARAGRIDLKAVFEGMDQMLVQADALMDQVSQQIAAEKAAVAEEVAAEDLTPAPDPAEIQAVAKRVLDPVPDAGAADLLDVPALVAALTEAAAAPADPAPTAEPPAPQAEAGGFDPAALLAGLDQSEYADPSPDQIPALIERSRESLDEGLREARALAPTPLDLRPLTPQQATHLGRTAMASHQAGHGLAGRDLAGAHLAGADLRGADLNGTLFENADLTGADLTGADLTGAVFTGAVLDDARLAGCILRGANLSGIHGHRTGLADADLDGATLIKADLTDACLTGARLANTQVIQTVLASIQGRDLTLDRLVLLDSDLTGAHLAGAVLNRCVLVRCACNHLDLTGARLIRVVLTKSQTTHLVLDDARLDRLAAHGADLSHARMRRLVSVGSTFRQAKLAGVDLSKADLAANDLGEAIIDQSRLAGVNLDRAVLIGAKISASDLTVARLMAVRARGVGLKDCRLGSANLFDADLSHARIEDCEMDGALMPRAPWSG